MLDLVSTYNSLEMQILKKQLRFVLLIILSSIVYPASASRSSRIPKEVFVRELNASCYPLHLPQATWAILPISHTFYTAYPTSHNHYAVNNIEMIIGIIVGFLYTSMFYYNHM
jgi:hypothetical protein